MMTLTRLEPIGASIWSARAAQRFFGMEVGARMTVCRLDDGGLVLISPIEHDAQLQGEIDAIGPIRALVSPCLLHHLYLGPWHEANPEASVYGPEGLSRKRPDLSLTATLGSSFDERFGDALRRLPVAGMPKLNESLFFHRASGTLLVTDFCLYLPESTGYTRLMATMLGIRARPHCDLVYKSMISDSAAFRASLTPLRGLPIERLSMCHHEIVNEDAQQVVSRILDALKVAPPSAA